MCWRYVNTVKGEKKYELIVEAAWSQEVIDEYVRFGTKIGLFDNLVHPCGKPVTPLKQGRMWLRMTSLRGVLQDCWRSSWSLLATETSCL